MLLARLIVFSRLENRSDAIAELKGMHGHADFIGTAPPTAIGIDINGISAITGYSEVLFVNIGNGHAVDGIAEASNKRILSRNFCGHRCRGT